MGQIKRLGYSRHDLHAERLSVSVGTLSIAALAFGALALGAFAVGYLAIGRLNVRQARFGRLEVDELVVGRVRRPARRPPQRSAFPDEASS